MTDPDESKAKMTWNLVRFGKQDAEKGILVFQIYSIHIIDRIPDARKKWDLTPQAQSSLQGTFSQSSTMLHSELCAWGVKV